MRFIEKVRLGYFEPQIHKNFSSSTSSISLSSEEFSDELYNDSDSLPNKILKEFSETEDGSNNNAFHIIAEKNYIATLDHVLYIKEVGIEEKLRLLNEKNAQGLTPRDIALKKQFFGFVEISKKFELNMKTKLLDIHSKSQNVSYIPLSQKSERSISPSIPIRKSDLTNSGKKNRQLVFSYKDPSPIEKTIKPSLKNSNDLLFKNVEEFEEKKSIDIDVNKNEENGFHFVDNFEDAEVFNPLQSGVFFSSHLSEITQFSKNSLSDSTLLDTEDSLVDESSIRLSKIRLGLGDNF